jgi:hypothetical protein
MSYKGKVVNTVSMEVNRKVTEDAMMSSTMVRMNLRPQAKQVLKREAKETGSSETEIVSRLVNWYAEQSVVIRRAIVGHIPDEIRPDVARMLLEKWTERKTTE